MTHAPNAFAAYPHAITPATVGDLLAFHRATFGGYRMDAAAATTTDTAAVTTSTTTTDSGGTSTGATTTTDASQAAGAAAQTTTATDAGKAFTQADLDRILNERLAKEREKFATQLEEAKATAGKSDLEAAQIKLQQTEAKLGTVTKTAAERIAKTEAKVAAVTAGAKSDRITAVIAQADLTDAVSEDGEVDDAKVAAAIGKVLEAFPEWKGTTVAGKSGGELGGGAETGKSYTRAQIKAMSLEAYQAEEKDILAAMAAGRIAG